MISVFTLLLFIPEDGIRDAFRALGIGLADEVGVHILGGGDLGVAKAFGDTDRVGAGVVEDGCHFGSYCNIPQSVLMAGAGYAQWRGGNWEWGFITTILDDPRDTYRVFQGVEIYEEQN